MSALRISGLVEDSIVDGPGLRLAIFTQGCYHHCPGCHNEQTHDPSGGYEISIDEIQSIFLKSPLYQGVTFSGGEPLLQPESLTVIANFIHQQNKNVWMYSGYTWEEIFSMKKIRPEIASLIDAVDILVDGLFLLEQCDRTLLFRGSKNQRIIDVQASLQQDDPNIPVISPIGQ